MSVVLHLVGEEPVECLAHGASYVREGVQDVVFCYLRFPSGVVAHLHLSWLDPHKERRMTVVGARRMATFDDMLIEGKLTVYDKGFDEDARSWGEYIARSGDIFSPRIANAEPLRLECEHFVECVRERRDAALGRAQRRCASCACSSSCSARCRTAELAASACDTAMRRARYGARRRRRRAVRWPAVDAQHGPDAAADDAQHVGVARRAVAQERPDQHQAAPRDISSRSSELCACPTVLELLARRSDEQELLHMAGSASANCGFPPA